MLLYTSSGARSAVPGPAGTGVEARAIAPAEVLNCSTKLHINQRLVSEGKRM